MLVSLLDLTRSTRRSPVSSSLVVGRRARGRASRRTPRARDGPTCSRRRRTISSSASANAAAVRASAAAGSRASARKRTARTSSGTRARAAVDGARRRRRGCAAGRRARLPPLKSGRRMSISASTMPEREDVAPRVELAPDDLLGRHVPELALELPGVGAALDLRRARDAEVGELHRARAIDEHVAGRDVAVHERERLARRRRARRGRTRAPRSTRERDVQRRRRAGCRSLARGGGADEARARRAVDVLHRHVELAVLLAEVEDLDDVRVAEPRADARLVDEHRDEVGIARELRAGCA